MSETDRMLERARELADMGKNLRFSTPSPTRPMVRWHGGKWKLAPWIISHFPPHKIYVEPFGGGGSVLLRKPRSPAEVYNDVDGEIVNLFRVARDNGSQLIELLRLTPFSRDEFELSYQSTTDPVERARRTVVRSFMGVGSNAHAARTGFRTGFRHQRKGMTAASDWANYPAALVATIERLQGVIIENMDAFSLIKKMDSEETLFYVDPPYPFVVRDKGRDYRYELNDDAHVRLAEILSELKGMVIISGYDCELYRQLYGEWKRLQRKTYTATAKSRTEVLWMNKACMSRCRPSLFENHPIRQPIASGGAE